MDTELKSLKIDRSLKTAAEPPSRMGRWIGLGVLVLLIVAAAAYFIHARQNAGAEVEVVRVQASRITDAASAGTVVLNATGYIIAAHKIELASKVLGRVAWIGVEKGDKVREGQEIVRLEDDEYRAQLQQAKGQTAALEARLAEMVHGSRPEEIAQADANLASARADLVNARVTLNRTRSLVTEGVLSKQSLDDAQARFDAQVARVDAFAKAYDLVKLGPRIEQIDAVRGQIMQAKGAVAFAETQLQNTIIRAPITGTILERAVEKGEFVTTSFVGDRGAKGYVVSLADLRDLQVELDINQNDFAKLAPKQKGVVTTDAYPDRKYDGVIDEISPEANRQKATVQVKVKVLNPDDYLRPEMNASVAFYTEEKSATPDASRPVIYVPSAAVHGEAVFVALDGRAVKRTVKVGGQNAQGLRIDSGLIGGEDLILNPPETLKDGDRIRQKR